MTPRSDTSTCKNSDDLSPWPEREAEPRTVMSVSGGGVRERGVDTPKPNLNPNPTAVFTMEGSSSRQKAPGRTAKGKAPKAVDERTKSRAQQAVGETPVEAGPGVLLERPELHTTLALGAELRGVEGAEFHPRRAVLEQLRKSSLTRNLVEGKIAEAVDERTKSRAQQAVGETPVEAGPGVLLERPELHTTLALGAELRGVEGAEFHPRRAVLEQLRKSSLTRNLVEGKIAEGEREEEEERREREREGERERERHPVPPQLH
ncbi:UNVERIFIED_CONTAM: hypothetical protein FKN15_015149 [Acipenser sinensis]